MDAMCFEDEIDEIVETFSSQQIFFSSQDAAILTEPPPALDILENKFLNDFRFCSTDSLVKGTNYFLPKKTLLTWFVKLNIHLAKIKLFELSEHQLSNHISPLSIDYRFSSFPGEIKNWGISKGLLRDSNLPGHFVFPLAKILAFLSRYNLSKINVGLEYLAEEEPEKITTSNQYFEIFTEGLEKADNRTKKIIKARLLFLLKKYQSFEGIRRDVKDSDIRQLTLAELSKILGISRERVRQIEDSFFKKIEKKTPSQFNLKNFLLNYISTCGCLVSDQPSDIVIKKILFDFLSIPYSLYSDLEIILIGKKKTDRDNPIERAKNFLKKHHDFDVLVNSLKERNTMFLSDVEINTIAKKCFKENLDVKRATFAALKKIGRPAHYSEIAEACGKLFPESKFSIRYIHVSLGNMEQCGIVWVGIRGTYALKEWGYERPRKTLFDTVADIVQNNYENTKMPVSFDDIKTEMKKNRKIFKETSLIVASYTNPKLRCVRKNFFIPRGANMLLNRGYDL
jgi:hypothetical protein